jgi:hypothetical protein
MGIHVELADGSHLLSGRLSQAIARATTLYEVALTLNKQCFVVSQNWGEEFNLALGWQLMLFSI